MPVKRHDLKVGQSDVRTQGGSLDEIQVTTNSNECERLARHMTSFPIEARLRPGDDPIVIGSVTSVHCLECFQLHFIASDGDGWMEHSNSEGEPLTAAEATEVLLEHLSGEVMSMA